MMSMFEGCEKMISIDLSNFNTGKVTVMNNMFKRCTQLEKLNVSKFNTENVINMEEMFNTIPKVKTLDLSSFNTLKCNKFSNIFEGNNDLKITIKRSLCSNILTGLPPGVEVINVE